MIESPPDECPRCRTKLLDVEKNNPLNPEGLCATCHMLHIGHRQNWKGMKMQISVYFNNGGTPEDVLSILDEIKAEQIVEE